MKMFALVPFLIPSITFAATISGMVTEIERDIPLVSANVIVMRSNLRATTNTSGQYSIRDVPPGQIVLKTSYVGYRTLSDTLTVSSSDSSITLDFRLHPEAILRSELWDMAAKAISPIELQNLRAYLDSPATLASRSRILTVRLDTLDCIPKDQPWGGGMRASVTFYNHTDLPVYLLWNYRCTERLRAEIVDSTGDTVRVALIGGECNYDTPDLIEVPPHGKSRYPKSMIWLQDCASLPDKTCTIRMVYSYELPNYIWGVNDFRPSQSIPYLKAIRGTFASENVMKLHGEKKPPRPSPIPMEVIVTHASATHSDTPITLQGIVRDSSTLEKLEGVWVSRGRSRKSIHTGTAGEFRLDSLSARDTLHFSNPVYPPAVLFVRSIPLPYSQSTPSSVDINSVIAKADSTDIAVIKLCLTEDYKRDRDLFVIDSAARHNNVLILDSLINESWLPELAGGKFVIASQAAIGTLVSQRDKIGVVRFEGLYRGPDVKTVVLEKGEYYNSKKTNSQKYIAVGRIRYMYRFLEGAWKLWVSWTPYYQYGKLNYE